MGSFDERVADGLAAIRAGGRWRELRPSQLAQAGRIGRDGQGLIDFSSNDYLGLALHPRLAERAADWGHAYGTGAGASRLVTGTNAAHLAIEARVAAFKGTEAALLFASGWQANAAVIPALLAAAPGAAVFTDRLVHASIHAGLSGVRQHRFRHNDLAHLSELLDRHGAAAPARVILVESVYSMDGDRADLPALATLAAAHDAVLIVDEAHATGVLGPGGAGLCHGVPGIALVMGTFSKALGSFGAYVACSALLRDWLVNTCSGFIFTTAPPPPLLGAIDAALDLVPGMTAERTHLANLADRLRAGLAVRGFDTAGSTTQIVPAIIGTEADTLALSARLAGAGMLAAAIRPPTVPAGTSRLRIALRAGHDIADVDRLLEALG
ncbi:8-amino-7-oxononanoate synthase [Novosphingobium flavum]|uniref:8-amino-7-oxononanoate synthase n=1 Tax=Novosphingobium aerophilum TaxID=2839843 RepID=A0A7X1F609_9SPHN|nr:8-amino-7-oxononanoate synthase [Novosphingobium aerophilum]MBC2651061.1 8-amino-7-oxononanoate synthase [Novosphingobium aerophilum]MBC2662928.1 8-amino-7-oxononanoate synthase [Novosphingobium aerophilum]